MKLPAAAIILLFAAALQATASAESDDKALAIVRKHCVMCHAEKPTHDSFREAPKDVILESLADLRKNAAAIYVQTIQTRAMPLGNQTNMTDDERASLGRWLKELP